MNEKDYLKAKKKKTRRNTVKTGFLNTVKLPADLIQNIWYCPIKNGTGARNESSRIRIVGGR